MDVARSDMTRRPRKLVLGLRRYLTSVHSNFSDASRASIWRTRLAESLSQQNRRISGMLPLKVWMLVLGSRNGIRWDGTMYAYWANEVYIFSISWEAI